MKIKIMEKWRKRGDREIGGRRRRKIVLE